METITQSNVVCSEWSIIARKQSARVMLIGVGPHARRTYLPHLMKMKLGLESGAQLAGVVELDSRRDETVSVCLEHGATAEQCFVQPFAGALPEEVKWELDALVEQKRINAVIISTEPLVHRAYLDWALERGLHVLVDKPLTTRRDVAHDVGQARGLWEDYAEVMLRYQRLQQSGADTCLLVNSHRRFHPGFEHVIRLISEIRDETGCAVTNVASEHCDGQWRLPAEIISQDYHPYNQGYGKLSHSGYHCVDMVSRFLRAGSSNEKRPDAMAVTSSFTMPTGFVDQVHRDDYVRYFGADYEAACPLQDIELKAAMKSFGEIDASAMIEFDRKGETVATASIRLHHNGFARRTWLKPGSDLYKGNGRVRHERHRIDSGPFQTIYIESYQANDKHECSDEMDFELGGNNHFDIMVFRNTGRNGQHRPMDVTRLADLPSTAGFDSGLLYNEQVKEACLREFLGFISGDVARPELRSSIEDHALTVRMMSMMYEANAMRRTWVTAECPNAMGGVSQ
jgi:predicted dehydrogenase